MDQNQEFEYERIERLLDLLFSIDDDYTNHPQLKHISAYFLDRQQQLEFGVETSHDEETRKIDEE